MRRVLDNISYWKVVLIISVLFICFQSTSYATQNVTFQWDANVESDLVGYKVYYKIGSSGGGILANYNGTGADPEGPSPVDMPLAQDENPDTYIVEKTIHNLPDDVTFFFVVTAYDNEELESEASNEVTTFGITSPQDGFYVNASNYTSYAISGMGIASANVEVFANSTSLGTTTVFTYGTWEITNINFTDFPSITEGSLSLTAVSGSLTTPAVTGTFDITAPSSSANSLSYANGTFSLDWTADNDTASTELWYKKGSGGSWTPTGETKTGTGGTISYSPTTTVEEGTYYFATQATDKAGNVEEDPSGDGDISIEVSSGDGGGDGGGGCFVATAAYGSKMDQHVQILSELRDKWLINNYPGQCFITLYNKYSPPIADFLRGHSYARAAVRYSLMPITGIAYVSLYIHPLVLLFAFTLLLFTIVYIARHFLQSRINISQ